MLLQRPCQDNLPQGKFFLACNCKLRLLLHKPQNEDLLLSAGLKGPSFSKLRSSHPHARPSNHHAATVTCLCFHKQLLASLAPGCFNKPITTHTMKNINSCFIIITCSGHYVTFPSSQSLIQPFDIHSK